MAQNRMDLLKYMPKFEGGGKDKDSVTEHVCAFKDYLAIHEVSMVAEGGDEPVLQYVYVGYWVEKRRSS